MHDNIIFVYLQIYFSLQKEVQIRSEIVSVRDFISLNSVNSIISSLCFTLWKISSLLLFLVEIVMIASAFSLKILLTTLKFWSLKLPIWKITSFLLVDNLVLKILFSTFDWFLASDRVFDFLLNKLDILNEFGVKLKVNPVFCSFKTPNFEQFRDDPHVILKN